MNKVVIDIGFGDSGKGITTDYKVRSTPNPIVCRFSGGQNSGHTVMLPDGRKHTFSQFGSGTMRNIPTYWSKYCTTYPIGLMNELDVLKDLGLNPIIYIDKDSPITTPYEIYKNVSEDKINGHGTCGVGVGTTFEREENFRHLTFSDLLNRTVYAIKMWDYHKHFSNYAIDIKLAEFDAAVEEIRNSSNIRMVDSIDRFKGMNIIFEGSQGLLLDQHIGFFPNVTRSNTGTKNVLKMVDDIDEIFLVTRAYQTRHGNGPMTNWFISENYDIQNIHEVNVNNEYQGKFKTAILDLDLLKYAIDKDEYIYNNKHKCKLIITCLDNIKGDFKFTVNGEVHSFPDQLEFVVEIADELGIDKVYISSSPFSENIHKIC